jgi:hypothetical protein
VYFKGTFSRKKVFQVLASAEIGSPIENLHYYEQSRAKKCEKNRFFFTASVAFRKNNFDTRNQKLKEELGM